MRFHEWDMIVPILPQLAGSRTGKSCIIGNCKIEFIYYEPLPMLLCAHAIQ